MLSNDRAGEFLIHRRSATPGELAGRDFDLGIAGQKVAVFCAPTSSCLVLGSSQPIEGVDSLACEDAGLGIVRRRSGGGAVLVAPGAQVWLDVFVPHGDPLSESDVGRAAWWLGELWARAISSAMPGRFFLSRVSRGDQGVDARGSSSKAAGELAWAGHDEGFDACFHGAPRSSTARILVVHRGALVGHFAKSICFLGIGPGEVSIESRKAVGISQRRNKAGAWLHSMAYVKGVSPSIPKLLNLAPSEALEAERSWWEGVAILDVALKTLEEALIAGLAAIDTLRALEKTN